MEIATFLRLTSRRIALLTAVTIICASTASVRAFREKPTYTVDATVFISQALPDESNIFELTPLAADFATIVQLDPVLDVAAEATNLPSGTALLTVEARRESATVKFGVKAPTPDAATTFATAAGTEAMRRLSGRRLDSLMLVERESAEALAQARSVWESAIAEADYADPVVTYDEIVHEVNRLEFDAQDATSSLTESQRSAAKTRAAQLREQLSALAAQADAFRTAQKAVVTAEADLRVASGRRAQAEQLLRDATAPGVVMVSGPQRTSTVPQIARAAAAAAGAAVLSVLAGLAIVDRLRRSHRPVPGASPALAPATRRAPDQVSDQAVQATEAVPQEINLRGPTTVSNSRALANAGSLSHGLVALDERD